MTLFDIYPVLPRQVWMITGDKLETAKNIGDNLRNNDPWFSKEWAAFFQGWLAI